MNLVIVNAELGRPEASVAAADRLLTDVRKKDSEFTHDGCAITEFHISSTRKSEKPNKTYTLVKPGDGRKIDMAIPSVLAHEAAGDVTAADEWPALVGPQLVHIF